MLPWLLPIGILLNANPALKYIDPITFSTTKEEVQQDGV